MSKARKNAFATILERPGPVLLDGGLATQLEAQGCDIKDALWSAGLLLHHTDDIIGAHSAYLEAGAECIGTVTYQASRDAFAKQGIGPERADDLMLLSVELANKARKATNSRAIVAASIGPYGAMLNDGSEYRGRYGVTDSVLRNFHAPRLWLLDNSDAEVLALETIPSFEEARVLAELLIDCSTPAWVSFSCRDARSISDGTPIEDAVRLFSDNSTVKAVGVNCTPPQHMPVLIAKIKRALPDKFVLAYPNSGESYNASDNSWSGTVTPMDVARASQAWIEAGAKLVGGCCRMGPEHTRAMAQAMTKEKL